MDDKISVLIHNFMWNYNVIMATFSSAKMVSRFEKTLILWTLFVTHDINS